MTKYERLEQQARELANQMLAQATPAEAARGVIVWNGASVRFETNDLLYADQLASRVKQILCGDETPTHGDENDS